MLTRFTNLHVTIFRATGGRIGGGIRKARVVVLHHVGRKSGQKRVTPLLYLADGDDIVIVASRGGSSQHPAWWLNLREMEETTIELARDERRRVRPRVVSDAERDRLWPLLVEIWPDYDAYQARTERQIPVIALERA